MTRTLKWTVVLLVALVGKVSAAESASSVVEVTRLHSQLAQLQEACVEKERSADVEVLAPGSPVLFRGFDSRSAQWPQVRAAYVRYAIATCVPANIENYVELATSIYDSALSEKEKLEVLKCYGSDAGRKFVAASDELSIEMNKLMYAEREQVLERGGAQFEAEMNELARP